MAHAFGPYVVEQELARGGMGVVYAVRHRETGVRYALKTVLSLSGIGGDELLRFRREADLMSRLDHPGIVKIHTAGVEDGVPYLVQSFLPGGSLRERLRERGRLPREEAVALVADLVDAVAYAHEHDVLHRDLKPHNVLFDERGRAVLVDFGLGRDLAAESQRLTETGAVMGTPGYMAPEQVQGERRDDPRTDVYGLGAILFALLTGQPPFTGRGLGILAKIVHDSAPDLSAIEPETPPALAATVARCLAKRPGDRFPTAADLARVLRSGKAPPTDSGPGLGAGLGLVAALGLVVLGLVAGRSPEPGPATRTPSTAEVRPSPTAAEPALPGFAAWKRALGLINSDPERAWRVVRVWGVPPPGLKAALYRRLQRQARVINGEVKLASADRPGAVIDEERGMRWLACLRLLRRLAPEGAIPADNVDGLPWAINNLSKRTAVAFDRSAQLSFVLGVIPVLQGQHVPGLAQALIRFARNLDNEPLRRRALAHLLPAVDAVPPDAADWGDVQGSLLDLLAQFGPLRSLRRDGSEREALALAERISERCARIYSRLPERTHPLLWRTQAKAFLQLGDLDEASTLARLGRDRDRLCRAILALCHFQRGEFDSAVKGVRRYLEGLKRKDERGGTAEVLMLEIVYRLRARPDARAVVRVEAGKLVAAVPAEHHVWGLRHVHLLLEAGRERDAKQACRTLARNVPKGDLRCCDGAVHLAVSQVSSGPLNLERVRAALAPFDSKLEGR